MMDVAFPYFSYTIYDGELNLEKTTEREFYGSGYSGRGFTRNKPQYTSVQSKGPIPQGWYTLEGPFDNYVNDQNHHLGDCVFKLHPDKDNKMFGRVGFLIHGDNVNHDASEGCIVAGPGMRHHIARTIGVLGVRRLKVI